MKKSFRTVALFLSVFILLAGCTKADTNSNNGVVVTDSLKGKSVLVGNIPISFPLTDKKASLNIMATAYDDVDLNNVYVWQKYEEMTGIKINWMGISKDERAEKVYTALTNSQSLDLILRCKLSSSTLTQYGKNGLILDLAKNDLLKNCAPNCWAYLTSHPDTLASVMNPDGAIYSLPQVNSGAELRVSRKIFINKTWIDNLELSVPETTEEFYNLLKAFKEQDANGNGDPNDEIPFCSMDWSSVQDVLFGSFGLANRGVHNQTVDADPDTGEVRLIAASDSYKDFLLYANRLYSEGLLDNYIFKITDDQWRTNALNDKIGVFANTNLAQLPADRADKWVAVETALEGPNGDRLFSAIRANFHSTGAAVIPASCENPELALKWLDYFWTDEGTLFYHMGIQDETFTVKDDGSYDYTQAIYDEINNGNKSFDDVVATYSPYPGGSNPTVEIAPYFMGGEMAEIPANAAKSLFAYGPSEYWPSFTYTDEEIETLNVIKSDLSKYISAMEVEFITGAIPFSYWDEYLEQLDKLKADEMLDIYKAAVERFLDLGTVIK